MCVCLLSGIFVGGCFGGCGRRENLCVVDYYGVIVDLGGFYKRGGVCFSVCIFLVLFF